MRALSECYLELNRVDEAKKVLIHTALQKKHFREKSAYLLPYNGDVWWVESLENLESCPNLLTIITVMAECVLGMGDIEILVYDYCEARISQLSQLLFPLYFY